MAIRTLKALSFLISYPSEDLRANIAELEKVIDDEKLFSDERIADLKKLMEYLSESDIFALQEGYVDLFDRRRSVSLHLFEHIHGDSKARGQAMVDLKDLYAKNGLEMDANELPDHLPVFLEFLSTLSEKSAKELLAEIVDITASVGQKLEQLQSPYSSVFKVLEEFSGAKADEKAVATTLADLKKEEENLDKDWEEPAAFDNSCIDDCSGCSSFPDSVEQFKTQKAGVN